MSFGPNLWLALAGYACMLLACWSFFRGRATGIVVLLILTAGLLRTSASLDPTLHEWDERYHALVAKHLAEHPLTPTLYDDPRTPHVAGSWSAGHVWLNKSPLPLWSMALSLKCFGLEPWAVRIPSILLSMCAVGLLFALARALFSPAVAFWSALLFAINGHLIELASGRTSNDHPDTFPLCLVLASLYAAHRMVQGRSIRWAVVAGVLLGLAFLSKSWPALIVLPVVTAWCFAQRDMDPRTITRCAAALLFTAVIVAAPWSLYTWTTFSDVSKAASDSHWDHFTVGLEGHARPWSYYWAQLPMLHGAAAPIALLFFLIGPFRQVPLRHAGLLIWWLLPYLVFSCAVTKMPGYVAIAAPAVCLMLGVAVVQWWNSRPALSLMRVAGLAGATLVVALPLLLSVQRVAPWQPVAARYEIPDRFVHAAPLTVVTGCPWPIELMFHTPVVAAYDHALAPDLEDHLRALGYTVISFNE